MRISNYALLGLTCSFLALSGCMRDQAAEVVHVRRAKPYHIVKSGETIESIANKYKMRPSALAKLNRLQSPYKIIIGQRLVVHAQDGEEESADVVPANSAPPQSSSISENEVSVTPLTDEPAAGGAIVDGAVSGVAAAGSAISGAAAVPAIGEGLSANPPKDDIKESGAPTYDWPVQGKIIQAFNETLKNGTKSDGIVISAPMNTKVKAAADGVLRSAGNKLAAYGKMVVIKHSDGKMTIYAHLNDIFVKQPAKGQVVKIKKGDIIGTVGKTGIATQPQLYFQVRMPAPDLTPVNPADVLP